MQVEHKTEKGVILFVKVPEDYRSFNIVGNRNFNIICNNYEKIYGTFTSEGFKLIALTTDITEEQARMMVDAIDFTDFYKNYTNSEFWCCGAMGSFKSLMQHLQVYEVNPFGKEYNCNAYNGAGSFVNGKIYTMNEAYKGWHESQSRTGKWIVLFKPN